MWRTTRVYDAQGIRQRLHKKTGSACVIKMDVRQKNEVYISNIEILLTQGIDQ